MNKSPYWIPAFTGTAARSAAFFLPLCLLLLTAFYYYPFFVDDAFISLRYADRFLHGHGLTWNDGEYVEGYSNLLWVLLTAGLGWLGFDLVAAGRVVCLLASVATMLAFNDYHRRYLPGRPLVLFIGNLAFALAGPVAIWSIGGLEGTLTMALLAWAYVLMLPLLEVPDRKAAAIAGVLLGFVCWTRPEGAFFTMSAAAGLWLFTRAPRRALLPSLLILCAVPFAFFCAQTGFRLAYYGDWLPNTYYAKMAGFTHSRLINGVMYVVKACASFLPLFLLVFLHIDKLRQQARPRRVVWFFLFVTVAWLAMLVIGGGDIEPGYRHFLVVVPPVIFMLMECVAIAYASGNRRNTHIFVFYLLACFVWLQFVFAENVDAKKERWEWKCKEIGDWLRTHYQDTQPLVAVSNAGAIPYYSQLPSLDLFGLTDRYLAHHPGKLFGHGLLGHELFNGDYMLSRKPDLVIFNAGKETIGVIGDYVKNPEFLRQYRLEKIELPDYTAEVWVRKDSKKVMEKK